MTRASLKFDNVVLSRETTVTFELGAGESLKILVSSAEVRHALWSVLFGVEQLPQGTIRLFGQTVGELEEGERMVLHRRIGAVSESGGLISNLKTWENVLLPAALHLGLGVEAAEAPVVGLFRSFGYGDDAIQQLMGKLPDGLSLLEKRLAAIARAQLMDPDLMVYEFPFSGLTRDATGPLMDCVLEYHARKQGRASMYILPDDAVSARLKTDHTLNLH